MSRDLFGFKDEPFSAFPDNKYFFSSIHHDKAITLLEYGLNSRKGFMLLTGLKGTGKTMTCNILKDSVKNCNVSMVNYEPENPDKFMKDICSGFKLETSETDGHAIFGRIMEYFVDQYKAGLNNLIIVDNAEGISDESLKFLNDFMEIEIEKCKLVQVIISGCPELHDRLKHLSSDLGPKFTFTVELAPLSLQDTAEYVEHRLKTAMGDEQHLFKPSSLTEIYNYSKGIPSEINRIAQKALSIAKEKKQTKVSPTHIKMAAARLYGIKATRKSSGKSITVAVLIIIVIGSWALFYDKFAPMISNDTEVASVQVEEPVQIAQPTVEEPQPVVEPEAPAEQVEETVQPEQPAVAQAEPVEEEAPTEPQVTEPEAQPEPIVTPEVQKPAEEPALQPVEENIKHGCITANSGLKVRSGPSVNTELIGTAPFNAYIELLEISADGKWWKTRYDGGVGYMYAKYIKIVESPQECSQ